MCVNRRFWCSVALLLGLSFVDAPAFAKGPKREAQRVTLRGKIYGVRPGQIAMVSADNNQPWIVAVPNNPAAVTVEGEGGPELLGPGLFVQFSAELDKRRRAQSDVKEVMVFTPSEGYVPGVTEQAAVVNFGSDVPDLNLGGGLASALDDDDAEEKTSDGESATDKPEAPKVPTVNVLVSGQVRGFAKGEMTVIAGRAGSIRIPVAEDAKVSINTSNYGIAMQGDEIEVDGSFYQQGQLSARSVTIKLAERQPIEPPKSRRFPKTPEGAKDGEAKEQQAFGAGAADQSKEGDPAPATEAGKLDLE
ncbi:MAG: hypothetical protein KDA42_13635 [Planctomycetales bacterium]|nr:hypothetical protein [Planctomycetales bacterium]